MKKIISLVLTLGMIMAMGFSSFAAETTPKRTHEDVSTVSMIYDEAGTFSDAYWGDSIEVTSSGNYKIYYSVKGVNHSSWYKFGLNGKEVKYEKAAVGTPYVVTKYYEKGSTISIGIHGDASTTYAYSVWIDKQ